MNLAANMLLQDKEKEVQEIAASVGYENPGKFSSAFRSVMGLSPAEYRFRRKPLMENKKVIRKKDSWTESVTELIPKEAGKGLEYPLFYLLSVLSVDLCHIIAFTVESICI